MKLHLHTSGLSGDKEQRLFPAGRAWLYLLDRYDRTLQVLHWEWYFGRRARHTGLEMDLNTVDGENGIQWMVGLWGLFCVFFTIERVPQWMRPWHWSKSYSRPGEMFRCPEERSIGISIFDEAIWINLWHNLNEGSTSDPWWWQIVIRPLDILLGRERYQQEILSTGSCTVPMPEHDYHAHATLYEASWKRPRWPCAKSSCYVNIETEEPIPLPGKGTTDYNLDDDASYSVHMPCPGSVQDAAREYAAELIDVRVKRCGKEIYP